MDLPFFHRFLSFIGIFPKKIGQTSRNNIYGGPFQIAANYLKRIYFGWNALIILFPVVVMLISLFDALEARPVILLFFYLIPVVHYYLAWRYYRTPHLANLCRDYQRQNDSNGDGDSDGDSDGGNGSNVKWVMVSMLLGICTVMIGIRLIFWFVMYQEPGILLAIKKIVGVGGGTITGSQISWIKFFIIYYWVVSWTLLLANLLVFSVTFWKHTKDLADLKNYLEEYLIWKTRELDMAALLRRIAELRTVIGGSINQLESFYTSYTLLGAVALGPMMEFKELDAHLIFYLVVYVLVQLLFWYFIYLISSLRADLRLLVQSPTIVSRCLNRAHCQQVRQEIFGDNDDNDENDDSSTSDAHQLIKVNQQTILSDLDWIMLHDLLSESWAEFSLMGVSFGSTDVIQKAMGMTSLVILAATYLGTTVINDHNQSHELTMADPLFSPEELLNYLEENLRQRLVPTVSPTPSPTISTIPLPREVSDAIVYCVNQYLL